MRYYETLYIVNPNLEENALSITMDEIGSELEKTESKLINHRVWGKKRLAYPIQKQKYGSFIILQFEGGEQNKMFDFETWMKLNNAVLRHMTVSLDNRPEEYVEEVKDKPLKESDGEKESAETSASDESNAREPEPEGSAVATSVEKKNEDEPVDEPAEQEDFSEEKEGETNGISEENNKNEQEEDE